MAKNWCDEIKWRPIVSDNNNNNKLYLHYYNKQSIAKAIYS